MRLPWWISMPGNTNVGSALAMSGAIPDASAATVTDAANAHIARRRTMDSDPSGGGAIADPKLRLRRGSGRYRVFRAVWPRRYMDVASGTAVSVWRAARGAQPGGPKTSPRRARRGGADRQSRAMATYSRVCRFQMLNVSTCFVRP